MQRPVVVFPLPDSPTRPNVSPSSIAKLTSSTALTTVPERKRPLTRPKCLTRWLTSTSGIGLQPCIVQIALRLVLRSDDVIGGRVERAWIEPIRASRIECATGRQRAEHRHRTVNRAQTLSACASRYRREKPTRVGMLRTLEDLPYRSFFDDTARVHDGDAIGGFGDDPEIVR